MSLYNHHSLHLLSILRPFSGNKSSPCTQSQSFASNPLHPAKVILSRIPSRWRNNLLSDLSLVYTHIHLCVFIALPRQSDPKLIPSKIQLQRRGCVFVPLLNVPISLCINRIALFLSLVYQLEVHLTGKIKVTTSDGSSRVINPGDLISYEDTSGKGHIHERIGDDEHLAMFFE